MPSAPYPVQHYPTTLRAKDGRALVARPLRGERVCLKCDPRAASLTIVDYLDHETGRTWPVCYGCAQEAAKAVDVPFGPPNPYAFVPYDDKE